MPNEADDTTSNTRPPIVASCAELPEFFLLSNETPRTVTVSTCEGPVRLASLEEDRPFSRRNLYPEDRQALRKQILAEEISLEPDPAGAGDFDSGTISLALFLGLVVAISAGALGQDVPLRFGGAIVTFAVTLVLTSQDASRERLKQILANFVPAVVERVGFVLLLIAALTVAVLAPALAMYFGTGVEFLLPWEDGRFVLPDFGHDILVIRTLQLCLIALASLFPALMFFQFRRERFMTIRKRMLHDVFRLDDRLSTLSDLKARYGGQLDSLVDRGRKSGRLFRWRTGSGSCTPLIVCTFVVTLGWILILLNMSGGDLASFQNRVSLRSLFNEGSPASIITPEGNAFSFAFLGAYFFGLQVLLRGYIRGDLTPKSYNTMTARVFVSFILAWLLGSLFSQDNEIAKVLCFFAGVVPETVLRWLLDKSTLKSKALREEMAPLTDLEGIDLYDRTRLADEGVTNVQALAHHNLVELMINTRIAVPRLVDWVDQSILYLHVVPPAAISSERGGDASGSETDRLALLRNLRAYGIRTATDLIVCVHRAEDRDEDARALLYRLTGDVPQDGPSRLEVALDVLEDDEWMGRIRAWRGVGKEYSQERRRVLSQAHRGAASNDTVSTNGGVAGEAVERDAGGGGSTDREFELNASTSVSPASVPQGNG